MVTGCPDSSYSLSQVSRHVCLSIVSGQQLPLQGAQLLLKGTSQTVSYSHYGPQVQTSKLCLLSDSVSDLLCII